MLSVKNLTKIYKIKGKDAKQVIALNNVSIDFPETGMVFLLGKSGSGKSTLLNTIGGLDTFNEGEIRIKGKSSKDFKQSDFDAYRNTFIGFIFQEYNILEEFTIGKNLALALELQGKKASPAVVNALLDKVDLSGYYRRKPNQLSGGQKQRVAIARALIKDPEIIMADEPTGALDSNTGRQVMDTLKKLSKEKLVIIVSHDREFAEVYGDRVIELKDGNIISDTTKHEVEANKSASGVSFIDDKIIHIKKGQKLNKEDLVKINQMIIDNTNNQDTIISFDEKPNREIKKTAFITDDGNREVFTNTTKADVDLKQYDPAKFKLIHSKMRVGDAFKMGSSSLKHKPVRLFFTILLSFVAFAMFGLADTMASFDVITSTYESLKNTNTNTLAITGVKYSDSGYKSTTGLSESMLSNLTEKYSNYHFYNVVSSSSGYTSSMSYDLPGFERKTQSSGSYNPYWYCSASGYLPFTDDIINDLHLKDLTGNRPQNDDEVVISNHIFNCLKRSYKYIETFADVKDKTISINNKNMKIVGMIQDDTDVSKYEQNNLDDIKNIQDYMNYSELSTISSYGLLNMCYITQNLYNKLAANNTMAIDYRAYIGDEKPRYLNSINTTIVENIAETIEEYQDNYGNNQCYRINEYGNYEIQWYDGVTLPDGYQPMTFEVGAIKYKKNGGVDFANLQDNQIVVGYDSLSSYGLTIEDDSEIQGMLDSGLKFTVTDDDYNVLYQFDVVAISGGNYGGSYGLYVSANQYRKMFAGYSYTITRMKNAGSDYSLVKDLLTMNVNNNGYNIQFSATSQLDSFASMIMGMRQAFLYVGIGFAVFASFLLMNFISISINYKKREIGVLRAIGAGKKDVFAIFFAESFVIAVINFVLATVATFVASFFINRSLYQELGFQITLLTVGIRQIALLIAVSVGVAFISTLLPVYKIARKNPIDSINNR